MTCLVSSHVCTYYTIFHHVLSLNHIAVSLVVRAYLITLIVDPFLTISRTFPILSPFSFARSGLTFSARASYSLGRHLNTSALLQARTSHTLGQPQSQPFKYFALNIFREISLILSPRRFSSFMLRLI